MAQLQADNLAEKLGKLCLSAKEKSRAEEFKTRECPIYKCPKPQTCPFYHSPNDRRRPLALGADGRYNYSQHICKAFEITGTCKFGDDCHKSHSQIERSCHPLFGVDYPKPTSYSSLKVDTNQIKYPKTSKDCFVDADPFKGQKVKQENENHRPESKYPPTKNISTETLALDITRLSYNNLRSLAQILSERLPESHRRLMIAILKSSGKEDSKLNGWEEVGWDKTLNTKKNVKDTIQSAKSRLSNSSDSTLQELGKKLKMSSLQEMATSIRRVTEELQGMYNDKKDLVVLSCDIKRNVNWSCHKREGPNKFQVTPENQMDAAVKFTKLVDIVESLVCSE